MRCCLVGFALIIGLVSAVQAADDPTPAEAQAALRRAADFFRQEVSTQGGYLWRYSADLSRREGESKATANTIWVQPPGTPSIGEAFLGAYRATGDKHYLNLARDAAMSLVSGQLQSGGWDYRVEFDPPERAKYAYRREGGNPKGKNVTTLDDDTTQSALRLLMHVDEALEYKDSTVHEAIEYALAGLLKAQFPNGAWPQRFDAPPDASKFPVQPAEYPESWPRIWPNEKYATYYTFNDDALADVIDVMFDAARRYDQPKYKAAAQRAGDFILLAQMPEPQPAWAQQYDAQLRPAWAHKFEPPSITGGESQGIIRILLQIYQETGDKKYLAPIPRALAYLQASRLPNGQLARFYELKTNKPLYFTKTYELTYDDSDLPTHYGFKVSGKLDSIEREYERVSQLDASQLPRRQATPAAKKPGKPSDALKSQVKAVIAALDDRGRWVEAGTLKYQGDGDPTTQAIDCRTFIKNVGVLSSYLAATR